jgi:nitroimidazol reductase NimA-like FMN-containing flavoprotein (pyridoxamine 5'-phosphate oxidase superfamily)
MELVGDSEFRRERLIIVSGQLDWGILMNQMRRKDREISDRKKIDEIIGQATVMHLAMADNNIPYVVPLSFGYDGEHIYFHSAKVGLKLDFIAKNSNVCFSFVGLIEYQPTMTSCDAGTKFLSVIGRGTCELLSGLDEKRYGLDVLMRHYTQSKLEFTPTVILNTTIARIHITELKGKQR